MTRYCQISLSVSCLLYYSPMLLLHPGGSKVKEPEDAAGGSTLHSIAPWLACTFGFPQHHKDLATVEVSDTAVSGLASKMLPSVLKNTVSP